MKRSFIAATIGSAILLAGCAAMPTAPMVSVLPGTGKPFDQFRMDDVDCRNYAYSTVAGPSQAASNTAAANAVGGAALGAAAGAIIGSATGNAGPGAAIGAGTGLLFGSAAGANSLGYSSYGLQRQYDNAYVQCMYAHGNRVPARFVGRGSPPPTYRGAPPADVPPDYVPGPRGSAAPSGPTS